MVLEGTFLQQITEPKKILCIHDLSGAGRCSLSVVMPVLAALGHQPIALPTALLSTHTGGLGEPVRAEDAHYGLAALAHYASLGISFDCIYSGYLATAAQAQVVARAYELWPDAKKILDPVLGDDGVRYASISEDLVGAVRELCRKADLILPNATEAYLLLDRPIPEAMSWTDETAQAMASELLALAPGVIVTGLRIDKYVACAGAGKEQFVQKKLHLDRSFPGTGDLFGALVTGSMERGNALSAAADSAADFVASAIQATGRDADPRFGVWFEPLLWRICQQPY